MKSCGAVSYEILSSPFAAYQSVDLICSLKKGHKDDEHYDETFNKSWPVLKPEKEDVR